MSQPHPDRAAYGRRWTAAALAGCLMLAAGTQVFAAASRPDLGDEGVDGGAMSAHGRLEMSTGGEAVARLQRDGALDEVAADVGLESHELAAQLLEDASMFVTDTGFVGFADSVEGPVHDAPSQPSTSATSAALPADVFALDSRPTSSRVLYLDFDGHTATDPAWASAGFGGTLISLPFDIDASPGFSIAERTIIFEVWRRVAEDYRPFDVNVTTRDPGIEGIQRSSDADSAYGQRVVVTPSNFISPDVIGVALTGVFGSELEHAAYVFTDVVPSGSDRFYKQKPKTMGEAVSHESGHTFGLYHDGVAGGSAYYDGHGSWAPIMGRGIDPATPVTQWSRGEYRYANEFQNDLAIIAAALSYRPDDYSDSALAPTVVPSRSTTLGNIGRTGDSDVFAVDVADGPLSVRLRPPVGESAWSNLAASLVVRNSLGDVLASAAPTRASGWSVDVALTVLAGRYTIEVKGIGWETAWTGFTSYGSLGAYELIVDAPQGALPPSAGPSALTPITPVRLVDTRNGIGASGRVGAGRQVVVQVGSGVTVPADAVAGVFSVTAVNAAASGFFTVYPCSDRVPNTSTLNFVAGQTVANTTIAALSAAGQLCVWASADADLLVDITGWLSPRGSSRLAPIGPRRVVDTRSGVGGQRLAAAATTVVDLNGVIAAGTSAVALNVTAVDASEPGFLTVYPCASGVPETSTVNYVAGEARPNNTIVGVSSGRVCIYSYAATELLVDLVGAFGPSGFAYQPTAPLRVLDTRGSSTPRGGSTVSYSVNAGAIGGLVPGAAFVNVTAVNHRAPGYVTTFDCATRRDTSTLNQQVGQAVANGAIVPLDRLRSCAWTYAAGDLIVDLNGWWVP